MIHKTIRVSYFTYYIFISSFFVICEYLSIHPNINYVPSKFIALLICSACLEQILKPSEKVLNSLCQRKSIYITVIKIHSLEFNFRRIITSKSKGEKILSKLKEWILIMKYD